ncbi:uncharacterized protein LOC124159087 [Ischnura elegans]|uniref:uncharacterized protein LOC124159087 n=1 Tax=Ischnura elegans TaxID=197161 RepID=UPI001ED868DA|nr:uncharacterized protein LOC124159087 [Ischnura elegans]
MYQPRNINSGSVRFSHSRTNWKTNLRERCRTRIKEQRASLYNSSRNLPNKEELKAFVMETIQGQWQELKFSDRMDWSPANDYHNGELDEKLMVQELEEEFLQQEKVRLEEYLLQLTKEEVEYGRYLEELQEDNVMCPLCGEHRLFVSYGADGMNQISCSGNCCLYKKVPYGLIEIRRRLEMAVETHSGTCVSLPGFTFTKEDSCLYLVCADCGTLYYVL